MKLAKTLVATALFAAATFSQVAVAANQNFDFTADVNKSFVQFVNHSEKNFSFTDTFMFKVGNAVSTASTVTISNNKTFGIKGGMVNLFSSLAPTTSLGDFKFSTTQGSKSFFLDAGTYFYQVTGITSGTNGGQYLMAATVAPVPEPETYALMGMGLVGLLAARRRKAKQA